MNEMLVTQLKQFIWSIITDDRLSILEEESSTMININLHEYALLKVIFIPEADGIQFMEITHPISFNLSIDEMNSFFSNLRELCEAHPPCTYVRGLSYNEVGHTVPYNDNAQMSAFCEACARDLAKAIRLSGTRDLEFKWSAQDDYTRVEIDGPRAFLLPELESLPHGVQLRLTPVSPRPDENCVICMNSLTDDASALPCGHVLHGKCMRDYVAHTGSIACPLCRARTYGGRRRRQTRAKSTGRRQTTRAKSAGRRRAKK